jgi:hypothetical protein
VSDSFTQLPITAQASFSQLVKGAEGMLHQNALQAARITELEEQLSVITKRKARKRKCLQHGSTLEYGEAADQVAANAALVVNLLKRTRSSGPAGRPQPAQRRCGNCGQSRHNARTCQKDAEISSESDASTTYIGSLFDSDEIEDA